MLGLLAYRYARNHLSIPGWAPNWDSRHASQAAAGNRCSLIGLPRSAWALWCGLLLWSFTWRLRRGLRGEIDLVQQRLNSGMLAGENFFIDLEVHCRDVNVWRTRTWSNFICTSTACSRS